jgi:hypothetical protein
MCAFAIRPNGYDHIAIVERITEQRRAVEGAFDSVTAPFERIIEDSRRVQNYRRPIENCNNFILCGQLPELQRKIRTLPHATLY